MRRPEFELIVFNAPAMDPAVMFTQPPFNKGHQYTTFSGDGIPLQDFGKDIPYGELQVRLTRHDYPQLLTSPQLHNSAGFEVPTDGHAKAVE